MQEVNSEGKCLFCQKSFKKSGMSRHLDTHLSKLGLEKKPGKSFHLKIESDPRWGTSPYFLHLWVDANAIMEDIDEFLRTIWLECCGHMSAFRYLRNHKTSSSKLSITNAMKLLKQGKITETKLENSFMGDDREISMNQKINKVLYKDLKLNYQYDFGSTTELQLHVLNGYPVKADEKIVLLSRNEPFKIECSSCHKNPATKICNVCLYEEEAFFCNECSKKHAKTCEDFADYAQMPVVNSPRMGVCAYEGGEIDLKRDRFTTIK